MPKSDDLATLFPPGGDEVSIHQGKVISWNTGTGANSVRVGNTILQNLPILGTGAEIALRNGSVVMVLRSGRSWFILGRVTVPGSAEFASASVEFAGIGFSAVDFGVPASGLQVTDDFDVPEWADEAIVLVVVNAALHNGSGVTSFASMQAIIDQTPGGNTYRTTLNGDITSQAVSAQRLVINPGPQINVGALWFSSGTDWPASGFNIINVDAIAIFRAVP